jgi:tellurite resistance protein TerC
MIGIIGAIVLRTVMILLGSWLIAEFHWVLYVFGAFLVITGLKMWWAAGQEPDLESNPALKLLRRVLPVSKSFDGEKFFTVENGKRIATLAVILVFIGTKMLLIDVFKIPVLVSLGVVVLILAVTMLWSLKTAPKIDDKRAKHALE